MTKLYDMQLYRPRPFCCTSASKMAISKITNNTNVKLLWNSIYTPLFHVSHKMATLLIVQLLRNAEAFGLFGNIVYTASDKDIIFKTSILNFHQLFYSKWRQAKCQDKSGMLGNDAASLGQWLQTFRRNTVTLSLGSPSPRDLLNMNAPCAAEKSGTTNPS